MGNLKKVFMFTGFFALIALPAAAYTDCASTAAAPPASDEKCEWVCKNLKEDWNYVIHPGRVNQCEPRELPEVVTRQPYAEYKYLERGPASD